MAELVANLAAFAHHDTRKGSFKTGVNIVDMPTCSSRHATVLMGALSITPMHR